MSSRGPGERPTPTIAAVVGPRGSGKTTVVERVASALGSAGWRVGGVTQPGAGEPTARATYSLRDAATGEDVAFARRGDHGFAFTDDGWRWAGARIAAALGTADCVVVDELGHLEAHGHGHLTGFALPARAVLVLVAVRAEHADAIAARLGSFDTTLRLPASAAAVEAFIAAVAARLATVTGGHRPPCGQPRVP